MVLDVVLAAPELTWLGTEREKVAYFIDRRSVSAEDLPVAGLQSGRRADRSSLPREAPDRTRHRATTWSSSTSSTDADGAGVPRVPRQPSSAAPAPASLDHPAGLSDRVAGKPERCIPASPASLRSRALAAGGRRRIPVVLPRSSRAGRRDALSDWRSTQRAIAAARRAFGAPRFYAAYRAWRASGDAVVHELLSPRLHDAWTRGDGRVEIHVLAASIPAPRTRLSRQRESLRSRLAGGPEVGPDPQGRRGPPSVGSIDDRGVHIVSQRRAVTRRAIWLAQHDFARERRRPTIGEGRRFVPPHDGGQRPQSGQERPPRQGRFAAPALTPEGVAPARSARPPAAEEMTRGARFPFLFRRALRVGTSRPSD